MSPYDKAVGASPSSADPAAMTHVTELRASGYTIVPDVLGPAEVAETKARLTHVYDRQVAELAGEFTLDEIGDADVVRLPLAYDHRFLDFVVHPRTLPIVKAYLGDYLLLLSQNGVRNMPGVRHGQGYWHRDLAYQEFVISRPLAVEVIFCLDRFDATSGGTRLVPGSHLVEARPGDRELEERSLQVEAPAGAVLFLDAMLFHRAGENHGTTPRWALPTFYGTGLLRQDIELPNMLGEAFTADPFLRRLLGYETRVASDVLSWRRRRRDRSR